MYYSTHYKTKWHDTDGDGVMRPSALLVYMQETANIQCREYGMDLTDLHHVEGKGFLLSRIMVKIFAPIRAYEDIEVRTWCIDNKSYDFIRCFAVYRGDEMMALAVSHWALLDIHEKKMIRTTDFRRDFPFGELPDESDLPKRERIPNKLEMEEAGQRTLVYSDLDFNRHMNNTKYLEWAMDLLPGSFHAEHPLKGFTVCYLNEARESDRVTLHHGVDETGVLLVDATRPDPADPEKFHRVFAVRAEFA